VSETLLSVSGGSVAVMASSTFGVVCRMSSVPLLVVWASEIFVGLLRNATVSARSCETRRTCGGS
jgi:hypothetical protein